MYSQVVVNAQAGALPMVIDFRQSIHPLATIERFLLRYWVHSDDDLATRSLRFEVTQGLSGVG